MAKVIYLQINDVGKRPHDGGCTIVRDQLITSWVDSTKAHDTCATLPRKLSSGERWSASLIPTVFHWISYRAETRAPTDVRTIRMDYNAYTTNRFTHRPRIHVKNPLIRASITKPKTVGSSNPRLCNTQRDSLLVKWKLDTESHWPDWEPIGRLNVEMCAKH